MGKTFADLLGSFKDDQVVFINSRSLAGSKFYPLVSLQEEFTKATAPSELMHLTVEAYEFDDDEGLLFVTLDGNTEDGDADTNPRQFFRGLIHI